MHGFPIVISASIEILTKQIADLTEDSKKLKLEIDELQKQI